jgi:hypothetical protein
MPEERIVKKVFENIPEGERCVEKPRKDGWRMLKKCSEGNAY